MKTVMSTEMVCHTWAAQSQAEAHSPKNSVYFRDSTIYSYGDHFPMAKIVNGTVLQTTRHYSVTTSKHLQLVRQASRHLDSVTCVDVQARSEREHRINIEAMHTEYIALLCKARRARGTSQYYLDSASALAANYQKYCVLFSLTYPPLVISPETQAEVAAKVATQKIESAERNVLDKAELERVATRRIELEARALAITEQNLVQWKQGLYKDTYTLHRLPVALRLQPHDSLPNMVLTSHGAEISVRHAHALWEKIQHVKESGVPYAANGHTLYAGQFAVQSIRVDGSVLIGCHTIEYPVMLEFAQTLGWA